MTLDLLVSVVMNFRLLSVMSVPSRQKMHRNRLNRGPPVLHGSRLCPEGDAFQGVVVVEAES